MLLVTSPSALVTGQPPLSSLLSASFAVESMVCKRQQTTGRCCVNSLKLVVAIGTMMIQATSSYKISQDDTTRYVDICGDIYNDGK